MKRIYEDLLEDHFATNRQMVFLSGPRQVGKTTLASVVLPKARYFNYDRPADAAILVAGADRVAEAARLEEVAQRKKGIVFDELHKFSKWKTFLKGFFDVYGSGLRVAVTGSARLNVYKRGGDSLMGRYFPYRIHPLSIGELGGGKLDLESFFRQPTKGDKQALSTLLRFGGFPEPFLAGTTRFYNRWNQSRLDLVFREDLRDLSRVQDLRAIALLSELLSARVTGGINTAGLATDLQVAPDTVKSWISILESLYDVFSIRPWFKNVANSIRKQPKIYCWDWSRVAEGGMRGENLIASHLLKSVQWWTDSGLGKCELYYVRDKQQREVDFLIVKDEEPFMLVECKSSMRESLSPALVHFQRTLRVPYAIQIALDGESEGVDVFGYEGQAIKVSALDFLTRLI